MGEKERKEEMRNELNCPISIPYSTHVNGSSISFYKRGIELCIANSVSR